MLKIRIAYCAKASRSERDDGCHALPQIETRGGGGRANDGYDDDDPEQQRLKKAAVAYGAVKSQRGNHHPTVKPLALMRYLVRLVTPPGGIVIDPFMGSGTTLVACKQIGMKAIGIEMDKNYCDIAVNRLENNKFDHD